MLSLDSAQPIACDATAGSALDAVAAIRTIASEEDGTRPEDEDVVERVLSAVALRLDGKPAAATVARRKRAVFCNALDAAATGKRRVLARNPLERHPAYIP